MVKKENKKRSLVNYVHVLAVPWCCILPIAVAVFGLAGGGLGLFLSRFTPLFLALSVLLLGFANYNVWLGNYRTANHRIYVSLITLISIALWIWSLSRMGWI